MQLTEASSEKEQSCSVFTQEITKTNKAGRQTEQLGFYCGHLASVHAETAQLHPTAQSKALKGPIFLSVYPTC